MIGIVVVLGLIILFFLFFELWYRTREYAVMEFLPFKRSKWEVVWEENCVKYICEMPITNFSNFYEATVVDVKPSIKLLYKGIQPDDLNTDVEVIPLHKEAREDGYWPAYIITPKTTLNVKIIVNFKGNPAKIDEIHAGIVRLDYQIYSRRSLKNQFTEIILVTDTKMPKQPAPIEEQGFTVFRIKTHLITDIDDIADVIATYTKDIRQNGDVVAIAESVAAITQHRYKHPLEVNPGWWARRICFLIPNVGSLSSRYGMQFAIDEVGLGRMLLAVLVGAIFKVFGKRGWLYIIAGKQSELIDDVTGTMPPYDKYIIPGPYIPENLVKNIKEKCGVDAAIVDVNNLKRVFILAATEGVDKTILAKSLVNNPTGNACEQTPFVLIRYKNQL